jgi:hypothetical protein
MTSNYQSLSGALVAFFVTLNLTEPGTAATGLPKILVKGWKKTAIALHSPSETLEDDPVIGRLICPPLTRFNLASDQSETLVLSAIAPQRAEGKDSWVLTPRSGVFWWGGDQFGASDLKDFLDANLLSNLKSRVGIVYPIPDFVTKVVGGSVELIWSESPTFGHHVLDGLPVWRKKDLNEGLKYECAGQYKPEIRGGEVAALSPIGIYGGKRAEIKFVDTISQSSFDSSIEFAFALPARGQSSTREFCENRLGLPLMTAIVWNPKSYGENGAILRRLFDSMIPRSAIVSAAMGGLGTEASSLIPANHPAFEPVAQPPGKSEILKELSLGGYSRSNLDSPLQDKNGKVVQINLRVSSAANRLLLRMLTDGFGMYGVQMKIIDSNTTDRAEIDAELTGIELPWPSLNFLMDLHSKSKRPNVFLNQYELDLDRILEGYALSLSKGRPDWGQLRQISRKLRDQTPLSLIVQHQVCLSASSRSLLKEKLNMMNPDWFRKLVVN